MQARSIFLIVAFFIPGCGNISPSLDTPPPAGATASAVNEIEPAKALPRVQEAYSQFVDVRTPEEYAGGHAVRAINIPLSELPAKLDRLERNEPVYVICQSGRRSTEASEILNRNGFKWVFNVTGGTNEWTAQGLPMETVVR
ncbi:MAG: rhodanese-like domain-containing protein [Acidobacteriota bacterium]